MNPFSFSFLSLMGLSLSACFGPTPRVRDQSFSRSQSNPGFYEIRVLVENTSRGEGEAKVKARLLDSETRISFQQDKNLDLKGHEQSMAELLIRAPEGKYELEVDVEYPPR